MVEDAGARADGGDTEAPAEAPRLKHTRSSRRRLERVLTESGINAEDRVDEYLEWFEAEPPAEIQQLRSCWCRNLFRFILYGATIAALIYFFVGTYKNKRRERFLSPDKDSGDCKRQFLPSLTGTYRLDTNTRWESDPDFEPQLALFIVEFRALPSEDYTVSMEEVASELREIAPMPLLESILFSATHVISVRDGAVRVRFDVDAASFMALPTLTAGVAGCPTLGDDDESFQYGMRVADGHLVFSFEKSGIDTCVPTEAGTSLKTVLRNEHPGSFARGSALDLTVDLHALVAATAINYGLVKPENFMVRLDPKSFERRTTGGWEPEPSDVDYAGYVLRNVPWAVLSHMFRNESAVRAFDWAAFAKDECQAFPEWSPDFRDYGDVRYYQDARYPGMAPVVCITDDDGADVCAILQGSVPIYAAVKFFDDWCNRCGTEGRNECRIGLTDGDAEGLDFVGQLLVGGPGLGQPALATDRSIAQPQWFDAVVNTATFASAEVIDYVVHMANARAASAGEKFCERTGFSQSACDAQDSEECRCAWDDGQCYYSEGARCPVSNDIDDGGGDDEAFATAFCEESGFTEAECRSHDSSACKCEWEDGQCWYNEGTCRGDDEVSGGDDEARDNDKTGIAFCEQSGFSETECKSYDSSECKCVWNEDACWYNEGACALQRPPMTDWEDDVDLSVFTRAAVCPLNAKGQLVIAFNAYDADRSDVKLNGRGYQLNSDEWSCSGSTPYKGGIECDPTGFLPYCDCVSDGDCENHPEYCSCPDAMACCNPGPDSESAKWAHADVFDTLSASSSTAPVAIELDYYKCKMDLREVVEEALGISVGNAALIYILTSVICVHALVRALGKCGAVRFRNGRFISPVVLDEYLERKSVDAVLRQEREKETEETDPFLSLPHDPSDPSL